MDIFSHGIVFKIEPKFVCKRPKMNEEEAADGAILTNKIQGKII